MNFTSEIDFTPSPVLLPFGGFNVAQLLAKLESGDLGKDAIDEQSISFEPVTGEVKSGWLRSKLMGESTITI
jgi:hypothetical protein